MGLLEILETPINETERPPDSLTDKGNLPGILTTLEEGAKKGGRNVAFTQLAGFLRALGVPKQIICAILRLVNKAYSMDVSDNEIKQITRSVMRYPARLENRIPVKTDILTVKEAGNNWREQRKKSSCCKTGYEQLDTAIPFFSNGEVLIIAGRSGTLKTTIGLHVSCCIAHYLKTNCLSVSLEMDNKAIFFRLANSELSRMSGNAYSAYKTAEALDNDEEAFNKIIQKHSQLLIVDKDSLTIDQIEQYFKIAREDRDVNVLLIDYLGYIRDTSFGNNYEKVSRIAREIKALAKRLQCRLILLCQTSREGKNGTEPVQLHHLRDSGAIEESADYILGIWHSQTDTNRLHCEILKNRNGERGKRIDFINSGLNLTESNYKPDVKKRTSF